LVLLPFNRVELFNGYLRDKEKLSVSFVRFRAPFTWSVIWIRNVQMLDTGVI
jgi:hypothetical protein